VSPVSPLTGLVEASLPGAVVGGGVGGSVGWVVDSVGGVDGPPVGPVGGVVGPPLPDGEAETVGDVVICVGVGDAFLVCALGDGEVVSRSTVARGVALTVESSSGLSPAPAPPTSCSGPAVCSPTTGGRAGTVSTAPRRTPNHIAGPSPTATIAPKSAAGPRSMVTSPVSSLIIRLRPGA